MGESVENVSFYFHNFSNKFREGYVYSEVIMIVAFLRYIVCWDAAYLTSMNKTSYLSFAHT